MERPDPLDVSDIYGTTSQKLCWSRSTQHPFNSNTDIEGSKPFHRSRSDRQLNPLNPVYKLPSTTYEPHQPVVAEKDLLWTLPKNDWRPTTRGDHEYSATDKYSRDYLFRKNVPPRETLKSHDITGPQFRLEEPRWRKTDPLEPKYLYDGDFQPSIELRRKRHGSMYPRAPGEAYCLRTDDIMTESVFTRQYPTDLIKTRPSNRTDDLPGAQASTWVPYPHLWKTRNPAFVPEKESNRTVDIEGAVAGTAGQGLPLYRTRIQAAMQMVPSQSFAAARSAASAADIAAVRALP